MSGLGGSTSGGRERDHADALRAADDALRRSAAWYLAQRDRHFALYWKALTGPSRRAPLATAAAQHGQDRHAWEERALDVAIRDLRILTLVIVPIAALLGALVLRAAGVDGDELGGIVLMVATVTFVLGMRLQLRWFARTARRLLESPR